MRFIQAILEIILSIIGMFIDGLVSFAVAATPSKRNRQYQADFVPTGKLLVAGEKGFCLTGNKSMTIKDSFSNALVLGGSGTGKSSNLLIPSILNMAGASSLIVHDPSGELYAKTSGAMKKMGYEIKVLNYSKPEFSQSYNPLHRIDSVSAISKISKLLIHTALGSGTEKFWNVAAENLTSIFIQYTTYYALPEEKNMGKVLQLINLFANDPDEVDELIVTTHDKELIAKFKALVSYEGKLLTSILATSREALSIFSDPTVSEVTKYDTICFEQFRAKQCILYICNSVSDMRYYSGISSIFFEQFFGFIMSRFPGKGELPIFFLIDESSSLYLSLLPTAISNVRKHSAGILQVYQHYNQIIDLYGAAQARNIAANSFAKVYMKGVPLETAKELEAILGRYEYVDDESVVKTRQLLTADEIRLLNDSIILLGNHPPIRARMTPYYEQQKLLKLTTLPPYEPAREHANDQ